MKYLLRTVLYKFQFKISKFLFLLSFVFLSSQIYPQFLGAGNAAFLNGTNSYLDISTLSYDGAIYANWTIEFWFKPWSSQNDPGHVSLLGVNTTTGANQFLVLMGKDGVQDGKVNVYVEGESANGGNVLAGFDDVRDGEAHHLALTYVNTTRTLSLFIDGNLNDSFMLSSALVLNTDDLWTLGGEYDSGPTIGDFFTGQFDNFRYFNYAKNALQVRKDKRMNITGSTNGSLICAFNFDEIVNSQYFLDVTSNNHSANFKGGINHVVSEFNIGDGASDISTVSGNTTINFANDVGLTAQIVDIYDTNSKDIVAAKFSIDEDYKAPNGWDIAGNNVWIVEQYSAWPQTKIKYTFTVDENLTSQDLNTAGYKVYHRTLNYGSQWSEWGEVTGIYTAYNKIEISPITNTYGEFMIARAKVGRYNGNSNTFPLILEAEEFDYGGEGLSYHDTTPDNAGEELRLDEDVDIEMCEDIGGGYNVGYITEGEWMEYSIDVNTTQYYTFIARVASIYDNSSFKLQFDGEDANECVVPNTGGWQNWQDANMGYKYLEVGKYKMRIYSVTGDFNINYINVIKGITDVDEDKNVPTEFNLSQNYPNPFNPTTTINYTIPAIVGNSLRATLTVYDILGNTISTLVNEQKSAGTYSINFDASSLTSGVYFYKLSAGSYTATKKMMLIK